MRNQTIKSVFVGLFLIGSHATFAGGYGPKSEKNIAEIAIENGSFQTLVAALSCTELVPAVSDPKSKLTVFAPTDEAFAKLKLNKDNVCAAFKKEDLKNILLYHVAGKPLKSPAVVSGQNKKIEMLNGGVISPEGGGSLVLFATKSQATVVTPDIKASNGIIHVIDSVLLP